MRILTGGELRLSPEHCDVLWCVPHGIAALDLAPPVKAFFANK